MAGNEVRETAAEAVQRVLAQQAQADAETQARLQALHEETERNAAAKAQETAQAQQAKADRRLQEAAERFDAQHKPGLLAAWLSTGGTAEQFETAWPALRAQLQLDATQRAAAEARQAQAQLYRDF